MPLILPAVEAGMVNENWRIRECSVKLLGELLFKIAGTSGKVRAPVMKSTLTYSRIHVSASFFKIK